MPRRQLAPSPHQFCLPLEAPIHRDPRIPPYCHRVYLHDEAPALGSGWRIVQLVAETRNMVTLKSHATGRTARVPRTAWASMTTQRPRMTA